MEKVVSFESSLEHYTADACVVWCFDDRFYKLLKAFGKQEGWQHIDLVKVAGGARDLAAVRPDGTPTSAGEFLLAQIKASIRLHGTRRVILMTHRDCGAYGGSKAFSGPEGERTALGVELAAAAMCVIDALDNPGIRVDTYFADFDGLYKV